MPAHPAAKDTPAARGLGVVSVYAFGTRHPAGGAGDSTPASVSISQVDVGTAAVGAGVHS